MNTKPDQIVAEKILTQLVEKRFLSEDKKNEWIKRLSLGKANIEDWSFLADCYIEEKGQGK